MSEKPEGKVHPVLFFLLGLSVVLIMGAASDGSIGKYNLTIAVDSGSDPTIQYFGIIDTTTGVTKIYKRLEDGKGTITNLGTVSYSEWDEP